jgi:hypothetical protein
MAYHDPCRRLRVSIAGHHTRGASLPTDNSLNDRRLRNWCQTPQTRIPDPAAAASLIERVGIATLYPVSPEVPNLFHAYLGDAEAKTDSAWDTPSGQVYAWRWDLGRMEAGFYTAIVRGRPTFVSWDLLPALLRLRGELRTSDELYDLGALSEGAYRIVQALEQSDGVLGTGELRQAANFPTGKEYHKVDNTVNGVRAGSLTYAEPSTGAKSIQCRSPWFLHYRAVLHSVSHYNGLEKRVYRVGSVSRLLLKARHLRRRDPEFRK